MDWEDGYDMFDNDDIDDSLIVEGTRGLDQPVTAEQRALRRRLRIIARRMQEDPTFNRDDYSTLLIEDFGLVCPVYELLDEDPFLDDNLRSAA